MYYGGGTVVVAPPEWLDTAFQTAVDKASEKLEANTEANQNCNSCPVSREIANNRCDD